MEMLKDFNLDNLKPSKLVVVVTSPMDYDMKRIVLVDWDTSSGSWQEWPYTVATAYHCSCYDFDESTWDATGYTQEELKVVMQKWLEDGESLEKLFAGEVLRYLGG